MPVFHPIITDIMRFYLFTTLLFAASLITEAQGVRFSVFADPQIAWLSPETRNADFAGVRGGIDAGFEMDNFFSSNYAFSTGLSINTTGGKLKFNEPVPFRFKGSTDTIAPGQVVTYRLQYANLPIGLKFTTREIGYTTVFAKIGMGGHFRLRSRADIYARGIEKESITDEIELFNFSYHFGAGIHYSLGGQTAVMAGFEYRHRFIDIASGSEYKALLNTISMKLGLLF